MALRLIGETETQEVALDGTTFSVRVFPSAWWSDQRQAAMGDEGFSQEKFHSLIWGAILTGWSGLLNADGSELPFSQDNAVKAGRWMPEAAASKIMDAAQARSRKHAEAVGN